MALKNELCFVQFIHPGKEHQPDSKGFKDWNCGEHRRKFLQIEGECVRRAKSFKGELRFWAEWEPQSEVAEIVKPVPNGPHFVQRPYYVVPSSYSGHQNTDPFVFGGFLFTGCQQRTKRGATQLRYLQVGSVILFGSCVRGKFAVDTVFVVSDWEDHDSTTYMRLKRRRLTAAYQDVTLAAWYGAKAMSCLIPESYRLYFGATIDKPVDGMFSFFPCEPAETCENGFARPVLNAKGIITGSLLQGKRLNRGVTSAQVKRLWDDVRGQVMANGQWLGVSAAAPRRRTE